VALKLLLEPLFLPAPPTPLGADKAIQWVARNIERGLTRLYAGRLEGRADGMHDQEIVHLVEQRLGDAQFAKLLSRLLASARGLPERALLAPVLSAVALTGIDRVLEEAKSVGRRDMIVHVNCARFGDEVVVLVDSDAQFDWVLPALQGRLQAECTKINLVIDPTSTQLVDLRRGERARLFGFELHCVSQGAGLSARYKPVRKSRQGESSSRMQASSKLAGIAATLAALLLIPVHSAQSGVGQLFRKKIEGKRRPPRHEGAHERQSSGMAGRALLEGLLSPLQGAAWVLRRLIPDFGQAKAQALSSPVPLVDTPLRLVSKLAAQSIDISYVPAAIGVLLVTAGAFNAYDFLNEPGQDGLADWLLVVFLHAQLLLGLALIAEAWPQWMRLTALGWFLTFLFVSLYQALGQKPAWGCLQDSLNPWCAALLYAIAGLALWKWPADQSAPPLYRCAPSAFTCLAFVVFGLALAVRAGFWMPEARLENAPATQDKAVGLPRRLRIIAGVNPCQITSQVKQFGC
jgi:hypothetical protein